MTRAKDWNNNYGIQNDWVFSDDGAYVQSLEVAMDVGYTLLRTRVDLEIFLTTFSDGSLPAAYPWPMAGWQTAVAICYSTGEAPTGYYGDVFFDWIFVQQVTFDLMPYQLHIDGNPQDNAILRNTIDSRQIDSKSMREGSSGSQLYLVIDSVEWGSTDSSQWTPSFTWTSRVLIEQPDS